MCVTCQVARIQQQVLDALKQAPQSNPAVQDAIARLNCQLFDISMVSYAATRVLHLYGDSLRLRLLRYEAGWR